ncbi:MAG: DUF1588 domain-containing protein [Deltaproteobacteria bacterium]|nr:DUF1588 domain-containing protein [Deltaproteobacteria bacterium]
MFPLLLGGAISVPAPVLSMMGPVGHGAAGEPGLVPAAMTAPITVPFFTQSTSTGSVSYLRIINHSTEAGTVSIVAYDDAGTRYGPATLEVDAGESVHFNAGDLEAGNADKGLGDKDQGFREGIGTGTGAWRLELTSTLEIEAFSYSRTEGGVVSGMQAVVPRTGSGHWIGLFNPASTIGRESRLRLVNRGAAPVAVTIEGVDDAGESGSGAVRLTLPAWGARIVTAEELESGEGEGFTGALGDGSGRWRLLVTAGGAIEVMHLLASTTSGEMTNLSAGPVSPVDGDDGATTIHKVGLFPAASEEGLEGVLRIVNRTRQAGRVSIEAIDDTGAKFGPVTVYLSALKGLVLTSGDLEEGNSSKGVFRGTGAGTGDWRLRLSTSLEIEVQSYVYPLGVQDGLLSAMHTLVSRGAKGHRVTLFDPGEVAGSSGSLRLINPSETEAAVTIRGVDGTGATPGGEVRLTLGAGESREVTVAELEEGTGTGLVGALGDGTGQWHLSIESNRRIGVMSLLSGPGGRLANLSSPPGGTMAAFQDAPAGSGDTATAAEVFGAHISEPVVHSRCIYCHVEEGRSGHTRLVFEESTTEDHEALNLAVFEHFLSVVEGGASRILNKIQGVSHGGGEQVPANSDDFAQMERFLAALEGPPELFSRHISERVVQSRCIYCHVMGGRSAHTRLVFQPETNPDHEALNLATFENFLAEVGGGASRILNKIQGVSHGGGEQVPADSDDFAQMERFLGRLDTGVVPAAITVDTLFDPVRMAPLRKTLRRAALIFAGRVPTEEEYASIYGGGGAFRAAIRNLMTGPEFHEFLIRGANDRLLTDRDDGNIIDHDQFVDFTREHYRRKKAAVASGDLSSFRSWYRNVEHGARRAPLELIAHVVESDLPYTEILTADYIMANPYAARAYGASTTFDDPDDPREFRPTKIVSYYRMGDDFEREHDRIVDATRIINPGSLRTDYPHAGILNTTMFLSRYPSTATNRNRARARWTYYHFLGLDVEKSASRTTDPVALADTNNPTLHNPACTVCHSVLDPVAGAFQDYGDDGFYKDQWGGMDSLHRLYKQDRGTPLNVEVESWQDRQTLTWPLLLAAGTHTVKVAFVNDFWDEATRQGGEIFIDRLVILDAQGRQVSSVEFEDVEPPVKADGGRCGRISRNPATGREDHFILTSSNRRCVWRIDVEVPTLDVYTVEVVAWSNGHREHYRPDGYARLAVSANGYEDGDTWYRDMRIPGFSAEQAPEGQDSLQWLAQQIVDDRRFAEATVRFWWPAIMGSELVEPPAEEGDADFKGKLLAANAQSAEVRRLAHGFQQGFHGGSAYNLKDLLVEIVLSKWFRADVLYDSDTVRRVALRYAGARRLLTPEELARKTTAQTGYQWDRWFNKTCRWDTCEPLPNRLTQRLRLLYGGIDSDGITERARNMTSVMAGVAKRYAVRTSCPVVMRELFLLPDGGRKLFTGVDRNVTPELDFRTSFEIEAEEDWEKLSVEGWLPQASRTVRLTFPNDWYGGRGMDRNVRLDRLDLQDAAGRVVVSYELESLEPLSDCNRPVHDHFALHCRGSLDVMIDIPRAGRYTIEVVARADQAGDELPRLEVAVLDAELSSAGALAIREKLVELHEKLLGVEVTLHSPDVDAAFNLFVEVMKRGQGLDEERFPWWRCGFDDMYYFDGIRDDIVVEGKHDDGRTFYDYDKERQDAFMSGVDFTDIHYGARTWVVVLAYLLTDYRYLML